MDIFLVKKYGTLSPSSEADAEKLMGMKDGLVKCEISNPRNGGFHRKYFALLDVLFDAFNPGEIQKGERVATKNRERFRKDIAIATGHYDLVVNLRGEVRAEARSISFAKMTQEEFERLYSRTIDYAMQKMACMEGRTREQIDNWVAQILEFD